MLFNVYDEQPGQAVFGFNGTFGKNVLSLLQKYDVVLPRLSDFSLINLKDIREDFTARIEGTKLKDYENFIAYVKTADEDFGNFMEQLSYKPKNIFICR